MGAIVRNGEIYGSNTDINDAQTSANTTWSSQKTHNEMLKVQHDISSNGTFNSLPHRIPETGTDSRITSNMEVLKSVLSNPAAQTSDWTVDSYNGYVNVTGTINGATSLKLTMYVPQ